MDGQLLGSAQIFVLPAAAGGDASLPSHAAIAVQENVAPSVAFPVEDIILNFCEDDLVSGDSGAMDCLNCQPK